MRRALRMILTRRGLRSLRQFTRIILIRQTKFPLDAVLHEAIASSPGLVSKTPITDSPLSLPDVEELQSYWRIDKRVSEALGPLNPGDRTYDWARIQGRMDEGVLKIEKNLFAAWVAIHTRPKMILEIGTRTGKSIATQLVAHPAPDKCTVFLIDPFHTYGSPKLVKKNLSRIGLPLENVFIITGYSQSALPSLLDAFPTLQFDYVLVDGSHDKQDALQDLRSVAPLIRPGGYCVFDDLVDEQGSTNLGLREVWEMWKREEENRFECREYEEFYGFGVARRN